MEVRILLLLAQNPTRISIWKHANLYFQCTNAPNICFLQDDFCLSIVLNAVVLNIYTWVEQFLAFWCAVGLYLKYQFIHVYQLISDQFNSNVESLNWHHQPLTCIVNHRKVRFSHDVMITNAATGTSYSTKNYNLWLSLFTFNKTL